MAVEALFPTVGAVLITAVIDSINPCAIGVLILLISLIVATKSRGKLLRIGLVYIGAVFFTYIVAGLGMMFVFSQIPLFLSEYIAIAVALVIVGAGLIEIKDFFWYGRGFSLAISPERAKQIQEYTQKISVPGAAFLGAFVAAVELPCTGAPYLAILLLLSQNFNLTAFLLLVLYNLIFVLPLLVILSLAYLGVNLKTIKMWKQKNRPYMRLAIGLLLVGLGWLLILIANGTITFI